MYEKNDREFNTSPLRPIITPDYIRHESPTAPPESDPDEPPFRCIFINFEYVRFILASIEYWCHSDQFIGSAAARALAVERFDTLRVMFMSDSDECEGLSVLRFRQNTINPCLLEYSIDAGVSYQTAFDYSRCLRRRSGPSVTFNDIDVWNDQSVTNWNTYNGDIINVAPEWNYGDADDAYRDMALCWAAERFVELVVASAVLAGEKEVEENKNVLLWTSDMLNALSWILADAIAIGVVPIESTVGVLALKVASWIVSIVAELQEFDPTALNNQTAQTIVACAIYDSLAGSKPTFSAWRTALESHGLTDNEGVIADASYLMMQSEEVYVAYLMIAADIVPAAELAGDLGCPCDDAWQVDLDCKAAVFPDYVVVIQGTHYPNVGVIVEPCQDAQGVERMDARLRFTAAAATATLTDVLMEYEGLVYGEGGQSINIIVFEGERASPLEYFLGPKWTRSQTPAGNGSKQSGCDVSQLAYVEARLNASRGSYEGMGRITRIRLRGSGQNPFTN